MYIIEGRSNIIRVSFVLDDLFSDIYLVQTPKKNCCNASSFALMELRVQSRGRGRGRGEGGYQRLGPSIGVIYSCN